ncbi:PLP-dependent aminotransferase family protein [Limoniibacter endophyticus]|uniref:GntR family transcriptional regulator n=1 Tax=Limoniibacter endophyticus TaxID=1565040 RepID=A0A8J3DFM1_9HYPH|nr:PLP-dependent aminotransferase family protein [Limoniibacter endophyticus]GHC60650.1 GntR family transcriptional regulator [Limoniibacter endophyticus]
MTKWIQSVPDGEGPIYLRLADHIERAIAAGALAHGEKLPPQRDLAYDIGVTVGTVGRAYAIARQRGLISGEVGRGTYVLARQQPPRPTSKAEVIAGVRQNHPTLGKLRFDATSAPDVGQAAIMDEIVTGVTHSNPDFVPFYTRTYPDHWFEAGKQWLSKGAFVPDTADIVPTLGAHAGVCSIIAAITAAGDKIVFEELTYAQIHRTANLIGRRSITVASDDQGMIPEEFEHVCAQQHPKVAFLMPSAQNPTAARLPLERRRAIAEIARRFNVFLIEDDLYGSISLDPTPYLAEFAPERTFLVGGLSKSVAAGVRGAWIACPPHYADRIRIAHGMMTGGMPFLMAETAAQLVMSAAAEELRDRSRLEVAERVSIARKALGNHGFVSQPCLPFLWLKLPDPWLSGTFKQAALDAGILIDDEDEFKSARLSTAFHRVRLGFSSPRCRDSVADGFATITRLLDSGEIGHESFA